MTKNRETYLKYVVEFISDRCREPEAAAIGKMVEESIRNKTYIVYEEENTLNNYDVIVTFNFAGDPTFGLYNYDTDGEATILISTPDGVTCLGL